MAMKSLVKASSLAPGRAARLYRLSLTSVMLAALGVLAGPAAAQPLPARPELLCQGNRTFERWGAGTAFPANRQPPVSGAVYPFYKRYRIHPEEQFVEVKDSEGGGYYRLSVDGGNQTANTIRQDGFYMVWSTREGWYYNYDLFSVSRSSTGSFTYKYVARAEDRNRLIFELHKSEGSCQLMNPVGG